MDKQPMRCPFCGGNGARRGVDGIETCADCGVALKFNKSGRVEDVHVQGHDHRQVSEVAAELAAKARSATAFPTWAPKAGLTFGAVTLLFLMGLTVAATLNVQVPQGARFLLVCVVALGVALSTAFIGGDAAANGHIPIPGASEHPVRFSMTGGLAVFVILILIGTWVYPKPTPKAISMARTVPFDSFWIYAGLYEQTHFVEGYTYVAYRPGADERGDLLPRIGDVLRLHKERRAMIANFKTNGEAEIITSPALVPGDIYYHAVTGRSVPAGALVLVRDVVPSYDPTRGKDILAIWCRVAECDANTPNCTRAAAESNSAVAR